MKIIKEKNQWLVSDATNITLNAMMQDPATIVSNPNVNAKKE